MSGLVPPLDPGAALFIHVALSLGIVMAVMLLGALLRERRRGATVDVAYESGVVPLAPPSGPFNAPYFMIAALFVIFDMASAILFAWAAAARQAGWVGLAGAAAFILVLLAALSYLRADGALEFGPTPKP